MKILNFMIMKKLLVLLLTLALFTNCVNSYEMKLEKLIKDLESKYVPLRIESSVAYWNGTITGETSEYQKYAESNMKITKLFSDSAMFNELKELKNSNQIKDTLLLRQLDILYDEFLANQADTNLLNLITTKESKLEQKYSEFRANYNGKSINDNEVENILHVSTDSKELEGVWLAHKAIGKFVADDVLEIVRLRNEVAKQLGFDNYHTMSLKLSGQDPDEISALFDELDEMTKGGFTALKDEMNVAFSKRYNVPVDKLMPWHFQGRFFQEAPNLYPVDLDKYYKGKDLEKLTSDFYSGIGIDVNTILKNSDLYPKDKKNQHAYCTDIDGEGDVRVLCNITDNEVWMGTMLHEFGHGVYSLGHDNPKLPYTLRGAAHTFTTEAIAMLFGRLSRNPEWMKNSLSLTDKETSIMADDCIKSLRLQQLVFSRWVQVVYRFEKEMYANPEQNLNNLWWTLVEKYQLLKKPEGRDEPDWASKIHIALYPCYYHNYQLGELLASQLHYYIVNNITKSGDYEKECYIGNKEIGKWLSENIFEVGMKYQWNDMIERATGEKLTAKYYKLQFAE